MSALGAQKTIAQIEQDIGVMCTWAQEVQNVGNREGHEDCKFVNARFQKGKKRVDQYMETHHTYHEIDDYGRAAADVLKFQQTTGSEPQGTLDLIKTCASAGRCKHCFKIHIVSSGRCWAL